MTEDEFENLKKQILVHGHHAHYAGISYWYTDSYSRNPIFVEFTSPRSKYIGSILQVGRIENNNIHASCSTSGAQKINSNSHFKNFKLTKERAERYVDKKLGSETVKDFFGDDINVGDYVFGEWDRCAIFGVVRNTKKAEVTRLPCNGSKMLIADSAMIEIIKTQVRNGGYDPGNSLKLLAMKYFIKVEDPTLYLLKL